jgi:hypothetical protein
MFDIQIIGIKFASTNQYGDFYWMSKQEENHRSLYIFNDNEEYHHTNRRGAGNAIMRMFNNHSNSNPPKSAGIPTGTLSDGGYQKFTPEVKKIIDNSIEEIIELIKIHKYHTIYFSSEMNGSLGTSIFQVSPKVINYITSQIYNLSIHPVRIVKMLQTDTFNKDIEFDTDTEYDLDSDEEN